MGLEKPRNSLIAEIKLLANGGRSRFILVEGRFDYRFWKNRKFSSEDVQLIDCHGRENVEYVINSNTNKYVATMLGVTDKDYDHFFTSTDRDPNLFYTDYNDLETTVLSFGIMKDVILALCDVEKMKADSISIDNPYEVFNDAIRVGQLRYISKKLDLDFPFQRRYPMARYYNHFVFNFDDLLNDFSTNTQISKSDLEKHIADVPMECIWHITRGHDCMTNLQNLVHRYKLPATKDSNIESCILCAFSDEMLKSTYMYNNIKQWETLNGCCMIQ